METYRGFMKKHLKNCIKKHNGKVPEAMKAVAAAWRKKKGQ